LAVVLRAFPSEVMRVVVKMAKLFIIQMRLLASPEDGDNDNNTITTIIKIIIIAIIIISTIMMTINTEQLIRKRLCRY
jgi:hypothetical protein